MKIVVLGYTGMLGRYITRYFNAFGYSRCHFDAAEGIPEYNFRVTPEHVVINCIGILKPYIDLVGPIHTIAVNSIFPQQISQYCENRGSKFIHICSDCVYSGKKGQYVETDVCDAGDLYAKTKCIEPTNTTIIRTSFIGEDINEDGVGLLEHVLNQKTMLGYDNCFWNGVTALQLCKVIEHIIVNDLFWTGVRHIHSPETISKYELCQMIRDVYDLDLNIKRRSAAQIAGTRINGKLDRSLSSLYDVDQYNIPPIESQLYEMMDYGRPRFWHKII